MSELDFQKWLMDHQPGATYVYARSWWDTYTFIRDKILLLMTNSTIKSYDALCEEINRNTQIVGTHWSKSLEHPVVKIEYRGVIIVFRYNFYDYEVAIIGDIPIILPNYLRKYNHTSYYYQGFPNEYIIKDPYSRRHSKKFMVNLRDHFEFFTFCVILKDQIDRYHAKKQCA